MELIGSSAKAGRNFCSVVTCLSVWVSYALVSLGSLSPCLGKLQQAAASSWSGGGFHLAARAGS